MSLKHNSRKVGSDAGIDFTLTYEKVGKERFKVVKKINGVRRAYIVRARSQRRIIPALFAVVLSKGVHRVIGLVRRFYK